MTPCLLAQTLGRWINGRQGRCHIHPISRLQQLVLRVHQLESGRPDPNLTKTLHPLPPNQVFLLCALKMKLAHGDRTGAITNDRCETTPATRPYARRLYLACDQRFLPGAQTAEGSPSRPILVA